MVYFTQTFIFVYISFVKKCFNQNTRLDFVYVKHFLHLTKFIIIKNMNIYVTS